MERNFPIERGVDVVYRVRPIFIDISHELAYEGPCRFGKGKELEPEFDHFINNEAYKGMLASIQHNMPTEGFEILEPHRIQSHTDNWVISEKEMKSLYQGSEETDFYFISTTGRVGEMIMEFALNVKKPVAFIGNDIGLVINTSSINARGGNAYAFMDWDDARTQLKVLRARKALAETRVLCVSRYNGNISYHCSSDSFIDLEHVTKITGTKFRFANLHEFIDQIHEIDPTSNYTTPGRVQDNISPEDMTKVNALVDNLMANTDQCDMTREDLIPSAKVYYLSQKLMNKHDCNAFTAPCPDTCSTCRINKERFTFCLSHSLNNEEGIPSACEYDIAAVLSKASLQAIANKPSYMGNTVVLSKPDGKMLDDGYQMHFSTEHIGAQRWEALHGVPNLIATGHSVANRLMKGFDAQPEEYAIRPFAYSGFGATMRYDFTKDAGQVVTMCRFSPNCDTLLVSTGTIKESFGYGMNNCTFGVILQVADSSRFFEAQMEVGNHVPFVYGDFRAEMVALGKSMGLKVLDV